MEENHDDDRDAGPDAQQDGQHLEQVVQGDGVEGQISHGIIHPLHESKKREEWATSSSFGRDGQSCGETHGAQQLQIRTPVTGNSPQQVDAFFWALVQHLLLRARGRFDQIKPEQQSHKGWSGHTAGEPSSCDSG